MLQCLELKTMINITYIHPYNHPKVKLCIAIKPYVFHLKNKSFTKINWLMRYIFCLMPYVLYKFPYALCFISFLPYAFYEFPYELYIFILPVSLYKIH